MSSDRIQKKDFEISTKGKISFGIYLKRLKESVL
jgi:hypothetical protein